MWHDDWKCRNRQTSTTTESLVWVSCIQFGQFYGWGSSTYSQIVKARLTCEDTMTNWNLSLGNDMCVRFCWVFSKVYMKFLVTWMENANKVPSERFFLVVCWNIEILAKQLRFQAPDSEQISRFLILSLRMSEAAWFNRISY